MKKRVYGFDQYKEFLKEGIYKPGFVTEYEDETSIDDLSTEEQPADDAPVDADSTEETPAPAEGESDATEEAPLEEPVSEVAPDESSNIDDDQEIMNMVELGSGVLAEYEKYMKNDGKLTPSMKEKIKKAFSALNDEDGTGIPSTEPAADDTTTDAPAEDATL